MHTKGSCSNTLLRRGLIRADFGGRGCDETLYSEKKKKVCSVKMGEAFSDRQTLKTEKLLVALILVS